MALVPRTSNYGNFLGLPSRLSLDSDNPLRGSTHPVHDLLAHPMPMCRYLLFRKLLPLLETPLAHSLDPWITSYPWLSQPCGYLVSFGYRGNFPSTLHSGYLSGPCEHPAPQLSFDYDITPLT